ncbi:MAG: glycosyltransferase family 4 protein [Pyrinomonadaceae bacterium]
MRLAVFTSKYPARVATFFERDMRALLEAGIDVDIFPIYPLDSSMWQYSVDTLHQQVFSGKKIHHLSLAQSLMAARPYPWKKFGTYLRDAAATTTSAARYGFIPLAKTAYVLPKAWAWANQHGADYDHVLAYWGNYAATSAYAFHRLIKRPIPYSIWLHAGADLYETPIYLRQKLLYADQIVTCCAFNRTFLAKHYADIFPSISDKINVCYHGLDFSAFPFQLEGRQPRKIVAVGRLAREKGFEYLLHATHALMGRGMDVDVEIIGDGEEAASLKHLADKLMITDRVRFRGWLKFNEVQAAMREAAMLVHPSDGLGDGLPNVIREAMALGTPVIASQVAGIHEALDDGRCGLLVPTRDVSALTRAIETLLSNPAVGRSLAEAARKRAEEKFDMWKNGRSLAGLLRATKRKTSSTNRASMQKVLNSDMPTQELC